MIRFLLEKLSSGFFLLWFCIIPYFGGLIYIDMLNLQVEFSEILFILEIQLIIRSHEGPDARDKRHDLTGMDDGYTIDHTVESGKLITLFSAPDYPQFQVSFYPLHLIHLLFKHLDMQCGELSSRCCNLPCFSLQLLLNYHSLLPQKHPDTYTHTKRKERKRKKEDLIDFFFFIKVIWFNYFLGKFCSDLFIDQASDRGKLQNSFHFKNTDLLIVMSMEMATYKENQCINN